MNPEVYNICAQICISYLGQPAWFLAQIEEAS